MIKKLIFLTILCCLPVSASALPAGDVANTPTEICPVLIGSELPQITLKDVTGQDFDLNKAVAAKPTVLIYFRGGW